MLMRCIPMQSRGFLMLTLIRVASQPTLKEWLAGILILTDVGLLIPTPQCHTFGTVKNGKNT